MYRYVHRLVVRDSAARDIGRYLVVLTMFVGLTGLALLWGESKERWDWVDLTGELAAFLAVLLWLPLLLAWRPGGRVTDLLCLGLLLVAGGFYLDWLDEFLDFSDRCWGSMESLATPLGLLALTWAFRELHDEQQVVREHFRRREDRLRDHRAIDPSSGLYGAAYFRGALQRQIDAHVDPHSPAAHLALVSLDGVEALVQRRGFDAQEVLLNRVAQLLLASAPADALVCRYAGNCFVVGASNGQRLEQWSTTVPALFEALLGALALREPGVSSPSLRSAVMAVMPTQNARAILRDAAATLAQA